MSARRNAEAARRAVQIRRVQEHAALDRLRAQKAVEVEAVRQLEAQNKDHAAAQQGWHDALTRPSLDPITAGLWRRHAGDALQAVHMQETIVDTETDVTRDRRDQWERQLRLVDAAEVIDRRSAAILRRQDEEQTLRTAEDLFQAHRGIR